jgi:hypothetical protein
MYVCIICAYVCMYVCMYYASYLCLHTRARAVRNVCDCLLQPWLVTHGWLVGFHRDLLCGHVRVMCAVTCVRCVRSRACDVCGHVRAMCAVTCVRCVRSRACGSRSRATTSMASKSLHTCTHVYTHSCIHAFMYTCIGISIHICTHQHACKYIYAHYDHMHG